MINKISLPSSCFSLSVLILIVGALIREGYSQVASENTKQYQNKSFTLLVYNVENLFDLVDNGKEYDLYKPFTHNWNHETLAHKIENIAAAISAAKADILVLSEIENRNAANQLQKALAEKKQKYSYLATGDKPKLASTCQIILSKFPLKGSRTHKIPRIKNYYTRNILEVDVEVFAQPLKIFALHWPSKKNSESTRLQAAKVLYNRLKELEPGTDYILAGDFNSNYNEAETFFTEGLDDTEGLTALNHCLNTVKSQPREKLNFVTETWLKENQTELYHYDLWHELLPWQRFSGIYKGRYCTLDHILLPASLYDSSGISYLDGSFSVFTWEGRLLYNGIPYRWRIGYGKTGRYHLGSGYSDHLPLVARFVKHAFTFKKSHNSHFSLMSTTEISHQQSLASFETGFEGWLPYSSQIRLFIDTIEASEGLRSLRIEGMATRNSRAAHIRLPLTPGILGNPNLALAIDLLGSGKYVFRIRMDQNPWVCYTGSDFRIITSGTRYYKHSTKVWQTVILPINQYTNTNKIIELEIRSARQELLCIWIDNFRWFDWDKQIDLE